MKSLFTLSLLSLATVTLAQENIQSIKSIDEFDQLLASSVKPVAAQFHSNCPVCNATRIHMQKLAQELNTVTFAEVDINGVPGIAERYDITALPTVLIFSPGSQELRHKIMGPNREKLLYKINETLDALR